MSARLSELIVPVQKKLDAYYQVQQTIRDRHHLWDNSVRTKTYDLLSTLIKQGIFLGWTITTEESSSKIRSIVMMPPALTSTNGIAIHSARLAFVPILEYPYYEDSRKRTKGLDTVLPENLNPGYVLRAAADFIDELTKWEQSTNADNNEFVTLP
jgi:hypothetical protein